MNIDRIKKYIQQCSPGLLKAHCTAGSHKESKVEEVRPQSGLGLYRSGNKPKISALIATRGMRGKGQENGSYDVGFGKV